MPVSTFARTFGFVGTNVHVFLRDLARGLRPRANEVVDVLLQGLSSELPDLWKYEELAALAPVTASEHVSAFLDVLEGDLDTSEVTAPPNAIEFARWQAKHGVGIGELLRAYRLAHAILLHFLHGETGRLTKDLQLINAALITLNRVGFEYIDRTSEQAVAAYQQERDRRLQGRLIMINEASKRIGTTLETARTAQELAEVATNQFADFVAVDLLDSAFQEEATLSAAGPPVLHRVAQSFSDGSAAPALEPGQPHTYPEGSEPARALGFGEPLRLHVSVSEPPPWLGMSEAHRSDLRSHGVHSMLLVPLWARGNALGLALFYRHRAADDFNDDDLLLAQEIVSRAAVYIDNARRFNRERSTALTLQRSLLPHHVLKGAAVETASRYLPGGSRAGVGGDWYDVIPLSGARVALVVGDVVGRGLHAAATMGRLRTAVRTLADIDLRPDELLTHLDDVVIRLQREEEGGMGEISATCLYAIYDPVSRMCSLASAGHVPPAVVTPLEASGAEAASRRVTFPDLPIGPPLGLGGLPFETAQFELAVGSLLVLYTDGLIERRARDVDTALTSLANVLTQAPSSLEETCDLVLSALLPSRSADDVALLVARTRALDANHVATLDLPADPAIVSEARTFASGRLAAWGLEEMAFTTELVVSELVTNAIRYGKEPIQLRMILQSALTCEVGDGSSTAPHLRRARVFDEGGRGLLLVAQLTERWGTRHGREGKVIWAEQALPARWSSEIAS